jgi:acyl carrier protein
MQESVLLEEGLLERVLATWGEVLERQRVALTADSNFFLSGGDSLDLLRILVRIREGLGVALDIYDVAHFSTPRKMARRCAELAARRGLPAVLPHDELQTPDADSYPCSAGQTALWFAELASDASGLYNTAVVLQWSGALQVAALTSALNEVLARHEILRTRLQFDIGTQRLLAIVVPEQIVVLEPAVMSAASASEHLQAVAALPFDLERGPLWRFQLVMVGPLEWWLLLCLHHTVMDGWSGTVLLRHLAEAYNAALHGRPDPRCASTEREFHLFCLWERPVQEADLRWWRKYLRGADRLRSWPPVGSKRWPFDMACQTQALDTDLQERVRTAARAGGVMQSAFFLAALRLALRALAGIDELCIGMPASVRTSSAQEEGVGYFVNLLVMRQRIATGMDARAVLHAVQHNCSELLRRRHVAFPELVRVLEPALLPSGNPWCDVLFAFQNLPAAVPAFGGMHTDLEILAPGRGQHPLKVELLHADAACICRIEYARELLAAEQVRALHAEFQYQLAALARSSS